MPTNQKSGKFYEIPTSLFIKKLDINLSALPAVDFYIQKNGEYEILKHKSDSFPTLALSAYKTVWIHESDLQIMKPQLEQLLNDPKLLQNYPLEVRTDLVKKSALLVVEDLFTHPSDENIQRSNKVVSSFIYLIMKEPAAYSLIADLSHHDPYTFRHSIGTSVNSIILAKKIGITNEAQLQEIGMAGLLHDIGKVHVRKEVINKPGPLDETEWEEMKTHPDEGYKIVKDNPLLTDLTKRAIREHHEEPAGSGYPQQLTDKDIHLYSRIVCIADIFNALTTERPYSKAKDPFEAFELMKSKLSHKIDPNPFRELVLIYGGKVS